MAEPFKLPATITADTWEDVWGQVWLRAQKARGTAQDDEGTLVPIMTNREALALVVGIRKLKTEQPFGFWYLFAAVAYGWDPVDHDYLDKSAAQADREYPPETGVALMIHLLRNVADFQMRADAGDPMVQLDKDAFDDPIVQGSIVEALKQDGAVALKALPIPTGQCKDKKTGKRRKMRPKCDKDGKGPREPITRRRLPCDKDGECDPEFVVVDPIGEIIKLALTVAVVAVGALVLKDAVTTRHDRRRRS